MALVSVHSFCVDRHSLILPKAPLVNLHKSNKVTPSAPHSTTPTLLKFDHAQSVLLLRPYPHNYISPSVIYTTKHKTIEEVGDYNYGPGHPMKPHRIRMTHDLLVNYDIYKQLIIYVPPSCYIFVVFTHTHTHWIATTEGDRKGNVAVPCGRLCGLFEAGHPRDGCRLDQADAQMYLDFKCACTNRQ